MTTERAAMTAILFSDLVGSTELMQRAGDDDAQRIFKAHYQLLRNAVSANGGAEVKSLGDGLMVAFGSAADAVRCAIAMQQTSRRLVNGERLAIKIGLNAGDALRDEGDYFGTSVVTARRLCDRASPGQILCSAVVEGLLAGRQAFSFRSVGVLELKGLSTPVAACEVSYETEQPGLILTRTPFVGRDAEMSKLNAKLAEARSSHGGLVMLVGDPGIGKSRMIDEFTENARNDGAAVLIGACFEGEWSPPYAPFVEAIENYVKTAEPVQLRADLGYGAAPIARLVPALREVLPDIPEPAPLQPDEERFRLLDAVSQMLVAISNRQPVVLVLDDLHWAERGTIAMLRHVARFVPKHQTLILGAYRDVELDRRHPLVDALSQLRREVEYERISLKGLNEDQVGKLLTAITEHDVPEAFVHAISDETDGNPFFIREVLIHLADEGKIFQQDGHWTSNGAVSEMGIPEGVRQVIGRRLARLPDGANKLLTAAAAFNGPFRIDIAAAAAGIDEAAALDAIDAALESQLVRASGNTEIFEFTHALIRHTLYAELSPPRQVRLHRQIGEAMERIFGDRAPEHAAELAYQFHRSASLAGADRGAKHALAAADTAERAAAWDEAAAFLGMALDLMPNSDPRRISARSRRAIALLTALRVDEGVEEAGTAAQAIAESEGEESAARFLQQAVSAAFLSGALRVSWAIAETGMRYVGNRRDATWAELFRMSRWGRMAVDRRSPGIAMPIDDPEFDEWTRVVVTLPMSARIPMFASRAEAMESIPRIATPMQAAGSAMRRGRMVLANVIGDYRRALLAYDLLENETKREGRVAGQIQALAMISRCHTALGEFADAEAALARGSELAARLAQASRQAQLLIAATDELRYATGEDVEASVELLQSIVGDDEPELRWAHAGSCAALARILATAGRFDEATALVVGLVDVIERSPIWEGNYPRIACDAAAALWIAGRTTCIDAVERGVRDKVVASDYRYPMQDGRTALARLCALRGQYNEASRWFAEARRVTEEQGARPCRAIIDYDEALMLVRRGEAGDADRALALLGVALTKMREIGMGGWVRRAEALRASPWSA